MKLPLFLIALTLSSTPAVSANSLNWHKIYLPKTAPSLAEEYSSEIVFVLLYNPGTNQEGIHSLEYDSARTVILLFESEKDALIYASRLENQNFPSPTVVQFSRLDIEQFIIANNYLRLFVESGSGIDAPIGAGSRLPSNHIY